MPTDLFIGIIGGTGLYALPGFTLVEELNITTPWGSPSSPITIKANKHGIQVAFLARHGLGHTLSPSLVPNQANIAALKYLGCRVILSFSAVGSLREDIAPLDFVLPNQLIDRTKSLRKDTFFTTGLVAHCAFGDPFDSDISALIHSIRPVLHTNKTLVCMEGPHFSTRAESEMYRKLGGDIINMSCVPEAKLAREAELGYQMICMATDYDSWRVEEESVNVQDVMKTLKGNAKKATELIVDLVPILQEAIIEKQLSSVNKLVGSMKYTCITSPEYRNKAVIEQINYILPGYY